MRWGLVIVVWMLAMVADAAHAQTACGSPFAAQRILLEAELIAPGPLFSDINHDGSIDIVNMYKDRSTGMYSVAIRYANGDGTYRQPSRQLLPAGFGVSSPNRMLGGDVNGDGNLDLIVYSQFASPTTVIVLLGDGSGGFAALPSQEFSGIIGDVALGKVDNDEYADLVLLSIFPSVAMPLLGNGDGTFAVETSTPVASGSDYRYITSAHLNADDLLDLVLSGNRDGRVAVLLAAGDGTYLVPVVYSVNRPTIFLADIDGNGATDIISSPTRTFDPVWLFGIGDGTFVPQAPSPDTDEFNAVGDFNGDGSGDLLRVDNRGASDLYLGNSFGGFDHSKVVLPVLGNNRLFRVEDTNSDGLDDLIVQHERQLDFSPNNGVTPLTIFLGSERQGIEAPLPTLVRSESVFAAGDINGDRFQDMLAIGATGFIGGREGVALLGTASGHFVTGSVIQLGNWDDKFTMRLGDLNDDGVTDVVVGYWGLRKEVSIHIGRGDGTFLDEIRIPVGTAPHYMELGDLTDDGIPDLVFAEEFGSGVFGLAGLGDGTFGAPFEAAMGQFISGLVVSDMNGDSVLDLVWIQGSSKELMVSIGLAEGSLAPPIQTLLDSVPTSISVGNVTGDQSVDVVVTLSGLSPMVGVLEGLGDGTFGQPDLIRTEVSPNATSIGDIDGNGLNDILVANQLWQGGLTGGLTCNGNSISIILGSGSGSMRDPITYSFFGCPEYIAIGDFNGDGMPDLAGRTGSGYISTYINQCGPDYCVADITTAVTNPGDPDYGFPDGVVDRDDIGFYVENWLRSRFITDLTTTNTNPGESGYGLADGAINGADISFYVEAWLAGCP